MTSTPVLESTGTRRRAVPAWRVVLLFSALAGFNGLLAEQGFEKYLQLLVGDAALASAVALLACFLGLAVGGLGAAWLIRQGRVTHAVPAYGLAELAIGVSCVLFAYTFHPLTAALAPLQNLFAGPAAKFQVRLLCGCLLVLPSTALMGASFPLLAHALDSVESAVCKRWPQAYTVNLIGALAAALIAPYYILPAVGVRGALWICGALGASVCGLTRLLPAVPAKPFEAPAGTDSRFRRQFVLLLAAAFSSGAIFLALEVIWTHLLDAVLGSGVHAFSWMLAAVLLSLLLGATVVRRAEKIGRPARSSMLFQCAALLLMVQSALWDHVPGFLKLIGPSAEGFKLAVVILLLAPPATVLGLIYPRLLASPILEGENNAHLAGYLSAANALGGLSGALLGIFVLVPKAGSEVSLKGLVLLLGLVWVLFLLREPRPRRRLAGVISVAAVLLMVTLGRWWDWGSLTAGLGGNSAQAAVASASAKPHAVRFLPASLAFKHEDIPGGFTTVVEQTTIAGETGQTIRTLYANGRFQGDDNQAAGHTPFGFSAIPSMFVSDYGRALLIGLGTGQSAVALRNLGYREIAIAEFAPGVVQAVERCFASFNQGILSDPRVKLYPQDGRNLLLTDRATQYDLITIEIADTGGASIYTREFYQLAHERLLPGGVLQQWVPLHNIGPRGIASELATASAVFRNVALWYYGGQGMLVAADGSLTVPHFQAAAGMASGDAGKLADSLSASQLVDSAGAARLIHDLDPPVNTDHNRWLEYAAPQYRSSSDGGLSHNLELLRRYR